MKKILITGGSGYLGRSLAIKLKDNYEIILGARNNGLNKIAESETGCKSIPLDVSSYDSVNDALNKLERRNTKVYQIRFLKVIY